MKKIIFLLITFSSFAYSQEKYFPNSVGVINDFENIFTESEKEDLTNIILNFEKETSNEIAIASIKDIEDYEDFDKYTLELSNYWGVGKKEKDNGLTIFFSTKLRKIRINSGKQTQYILTDEICNDILNDLILPEFKKKNYFLGIKNGLLGLVDKWKNK